MTPSIAFRVDANSEIGAGHLMRCLALAQAWQDSGALCSFLLRDTPVSFQERLRREDMKLIALRDDHPDTVLKELTRIGCNWLVIDGYRFDRRYRATLAAGPVPILALDDNGETSGVSARLVLNQNGHASPSLYEDKEPGVELLLGSKYVLLRRDFRLAPPTLRSNDCVHNVLVTLGGGDHEMAISFVVEAVVASIGSNATCVVVTDSFQPPMSPQIVVRHRVDDMAALMSEADLAVTGGGSTIFEAAALGLPVLPIILAANQEGLALQLAADGGCFTPVRSLQTFADRFRRALLDTTMQESIRVRGPQIIDRQGASRVVSRMQAILSAQTNVVKQDGRVA